MYTECPKTKDIFLTHYMSQCSGKNLYSSITACLSVFLVIDVQCIEHFRLRVAKPK